MNRPLHRIAALLAFGLGALGVIAGGPVLLGRDPGYTVISWLPAVNFGLGLLTVFGTAVLIWNHSRWALPAALATVGANALIMLILLGAYRGVVAPASLVAMSLRLAVGLIVLGLLFFDARSRPVAA